MNKNNSIIAAISLHSGRLILIKSGHPIQIAYTDDWGAEYILVNIGDKDEYLPSQSSIHFLTDNCIFIGTSKGRIFRSQDVGETWQVVEDGNISNTACMFIESIDDKTVLSSFEIGIIARSFDKGETWEELAFVDWNK